MRADGSTYTMTGVVQNMSTEPELLDDPLRAQLQLEGPQLLKVVFVRDRRAQADIDLVTIHWPAASANEVSFRIDSDARVALTGGDREMWVQLRTEGEQVQGRFISKQTGTRLRFDVDSKYANLPATRVLRDRLAAIETVEIDAGFEGRWDDYRMSVNTNLDRLLRDATDEAIQVQLAESKRVLAEKIDRVSREQQEKLTQWFAEKQVEALSLKSSTDGLVEAVNKKLLGGVDSAEVTLGRLRKFLR